MSVKLHPYVCWCGESPREAAVLAFARTAKEARKLAYHDPDLGPCEEWIDMRARRLRTDVDYLMSLCKRDEPHTILPPVCPTCEMWGRRPMEGGVMCGYCADV